MAEIGVSCSLRAGQVVVDFCANDSPAHLAGIVKGDTIVSIDGVAVSSVNDVIVHCRGVAGSEMLLGIRDCAGKVFLVPVKRKHVGTSATLSPALGATICEHDPNPIFGELAADGILTMNGIEAGDILLQVNGNSVAGKPISQILTYLSAYDRGEDLFLVTTKADGENRMNLFIPGQISQDKAASRKSLSPSSFVSPTKRSSSPPPSTRSYSNFSSSSSPANIVQHFIDILTPFQNYFAEATYDREWKRSSPSSTAQQPWLPQWKESVQDIMIKSLRQLQSDTALCVRLLQLKQEHKKITESSTLMGSAHGALLLEPEMQKQLGELELLSSRLSKQSASIHTDVKDLTLTFDQLISLTSPNKLQDPEKQALIDLIQNLKDDVEHLKQQNAVLVNRTNEARNEAKRLQEIASNAAEREKIKSEQCNAAQNSANNFNELLRKSYDEHSRVISEEKRRSADLLAELENVKRSLKEENLQHEANRNEFKETIVAANRKLQEQQEYAQQEFDNLQALLSEAKSSLEALQEDNDCLRGDRAAKIQELMDLKESLKETKEQCKTMTEFCDQLSTANNTLESELIIAKSQLDAERSALETTKILVKEISDEKNAQIDNLQEKLSQFDIKLTNTSKMNAELSTEVGNLKLLLAEARENQGMVQNRHEATVTELSYCNQSLMGDYEALKKKTEDDMLLLNAELNELRSTASHLETMELKMQSLESNLADLQESNSELSGKNIDLIAQLNDYENIVKRLEEEKISLLSKNIHHEKTVERLQMDSEEAASRFAQMTTDLAVSKSALQSQVDQLRSKCISLNEQNRKLEDLLTSERETKTITIINQEEGEKVINNLKNQNEELVVTLNRLRNQGIISKMERDKLREDLRDARKEAADAWNEASYAFRAASPAHTRGRSSSPTPSPQKTVSPNGNLNTSSASSSSNHQRTPSPPSQSATLRSHHIVTSAGSSTLISRSPYGTSPLRSASKSPNNYSNNSDYADVDVDGRPEDPDFEAFVRSKRSSVRSPGFMA